MPMPVAAGRAEYPNGKIEVMKLNYRSYIVNASQIAEDLGNSKCMNVVLPGVLIKALGMTVVDWVGILRNSLPQKVVDLNIKALNAGFAL
jgi:indolepyruvate ferredoxin oxidoreductase beta subunit